MVVHHYSLRKIKEIEDVNCNHLSSTPHSRPIYKNRRYISWDDEYSSPHVFWVSNLNRNGWIKCRSNDSNYNYRYTIRLKASKRSLIMNNMEDVRRFTNEFWEESSLFIQWRKVCNQYDFVYLNFWSGGMSGHRYWYAYWDCASGIIFRTRIIRSVKEEKL